MDAKCFFSPLSSALYSLISPAKENKSLLVNALM
jgi:hypothetical protein